MCENNTKHLKPQHQQFLFHNFRHIYIGIHANAEDAAHYLCSRGGWAHAGQKLGRPCACGDAPGNVSLLVPIQKYIFLKRFNVAASALFIAFQKIVIYLLIYYY